MFVLHIVITRLCATPRSSQAKAPKNLTSLKHPKVVTMWETQRSSTGEQAVRNYIGCYKHIVHQRALYVNMKPGYSRQGSQCHLPGRKLDEPANRVESAVLFQSQAHTQRSISLGGHPFNRVLYTGVLLSR